MIRSMTGFGSAEKVTDSYTFRVEIKTLNGKFFDPVLKLPRELGTWEIEIKSLLENGLKRGKISVVVDLISKDPSDTPVIIDDKLFSLYYDKYSRLAMDVKGDTKDLFKLALHSPNVILPKESASEIIPQRVVMATFGDAIAKCNEFRHREGEKLGCALRESVAQIKRGLEKIRDLDPGRIKGIKNRLQQAISEIKAKVQADENRFEQELIYYIEKLDISEEKVRLQSHLDHFMESLDRDEIHGKKLGFISQEIGREINTIGSKANDAGIQREVVGMKEELEKIKEQVLNVL